MIDLAAKFGLYSETDSETRDTQTSKYTLVAENEEFKVGLLVKEVPNTLTIAEKDLQDTSNVVPENQEDGDFIQGIVKLDNRLIILIDMMQVIKGSDIKSVGTDVMTYK